MNAKIKEIEEVKQFKPFDFSIRIESEEDLQDLWNVFNVSKAILQKGNNTVIDENVKLLFSSKFNMYYPWKILDNKRKELNIKIPQVEYE